MFKRVESLLLTNNSKAKKWQATLILQYVSTCCCIICKMCMILFTSFGVSSLTALLLFCNVEYKGLFVHCTYECSISYFHQEEKTRMLAKVFRKRVLCWKDSQKLQAAEEGRYLPNFFIFANP